MMNIEKSNGQHSDVLILTNTLIPEQLRRFRGEWDTIAGKTCLILHRMDNEDISDEERMKR